MRLLLIAWLACVAVACSRRPAIEVEPACAGNPCCGSCAVLKAAGCPEWKPTACGLECVEVCNNANASGIVWMPDVSRCRDVDCIRTRGVRCESPIVGRP